MKEILEVLSTPRDYVQDPGINTQTLDQMVKFAKLTHEFFPNMLIEVSYAHFDKNIMSEDRPDVAKIYEAIRESSPGIESVLSTFGMTHSPGVDVRDCKNIKSMLESKTDIAVIFGKSDPHHVKTLRDKEGEMSTERYLPIISKTVDYLLNNNTHKFKRVIFDAEHFFTGFDEDENYAIDSLKAALEAGADTAVLCDTIGTLRPLSLIRTLKRLFTEKYADGMTLTEKYPDVRWGFHGHNDWNNADANAITFVEYMKDDIGIDRIHVQTTSGGGGERCGNSNTNTLLPQVVEKLGIPLEFDHNGLYNYSHDAAKITGTQIGKKDPIVGDWAFLHKAGMHIKSVLNGGRYIDTDPDRWGNEEKFMFTSMSGRPYLADFVNRFGFDINRNEPDLIRLQSVLAKMESQGYDFTDSEMQFLLINSIFGDRHYDLSTRKWETITGSEMRDGKLYRASRTTIFGTQKSVIPEGFGLTSESSKGPVDSLMNAMKLGVSGTYHQVKDIDISDFNVEIASPDGSQSTVLVYANFAANGYRWRTQGVSPNIQEAAKIAIENGFQYNLLREPKF